MIAVAQLAVLAAIASLVWPVLRDETSTEANRAARVVALAIEALVVVVLLGLAGGCHRSKAPKVPKPEAVLPVAIVAWPSPVKPTCDLVELNIPPTLAPRNAIDGGNGDPTQRYYVNARDVVDLAAWIQRAQVAIEQQRRCLQKMTEGK